MALNVCVHVCLDNFTIIVVVNCRKRRTTKRYRNFFNQLLLDNETQQKNMQTYQIIGKSIIVRMCITQSNSRTCNVLSLQRPCMVKCRKLTLWWCWRQVNGVAWFTISWFWPYNTSCSMCGIRFHFPVFGVICIAFRKS